MSLLDSSESSANDEVSFSKYRIEQVKRNVFKNFDSYLDSNKPSTSTIQERADSLIQNDINIEILDIVCEDGVIITTTNKENNLQELTPLEIAGSNLNDSNIANYNESTTVEVRKNLTRKRQNCPEKWVQNVRKKKREAGQEYVDIKGKTHPMRAVKTGCKNTICRFKCSINISPDQRENIHEAFWRLSDSKKGHFYSKYVIQNLKARKRGDTDRKIFSFEYFLEGNGGKKRVCKEFFLGTLNISSRRIYYHFSKVNNVSTGLPRSPLKGKNTKKVISPERKEEVRQHISSFPLVESHYCRSTTNKLYLESSLSLAQMYRLYCLNVENPVKFHIYSKIFNSEYNYAFHKPKKDICDKCAEFKLDHTPSPERKVLQEIHIKNKDLAKTERDQDRKIMDTKTAVITFDLENVFSLPKSNVSSHFYKQKLNCYNLTGHCNINKTVYCSVWNEGMTGRSGLDLANALIKILTEAVKDIPELTRIILWSDSCVPQNKNSIMSFAIQSFLNSPENISVKTIEQKFCEPGHSSLQEVDSAHSVIEKHVRYLDIYSPLSFIRCLTKLPKEKIKFRIIQMNTSAYKNFNPKEAYSDFKYDVIPYTKVRHILYEKNNMCTIKYKLSFDEVFISSSILNNIPRKTRKRKCRKIDLVEFPKVPCLKLKGSLSEEKKKSLYSMLSTMPLEDRNYYESTVLKGYHSKKK